MNYANHIGYSDVNPHEVVKVVSDKCLEIRAMNAERLNPENKLGFIAGGFMGHCSNQSAQEWAITSDKTASTFRIRLRKDGKWFDKHGSRYKIEDAPRKFYDYNF